MEVKNRGYERQEKRRGVDVSAYTTRTLILDPRSLLKHALDAEKVEVGGDMHV